MGIEDPGPDVAEQKRPIAYIDEDDEELSDSADVLEADPVDVADQHRVVPVIEKDDPFN